MMQLAKKAKNLLQIISKPQAGELEVTISNGNVKMFMNSCTHPNPRGRITRSKFDLHPDALGVFIPAERRAPRGNLGAATNTNRTANSQTIF